MEKIIYAIPIFGLLILIEFAYGFFKNNNTYADVKDAISSLTLGISHVLATILVSSIIIYINYFIYEYRILDLSNNWYIIVILFLLVDFSFYIWHRASHRVRFLWANHVNHHSSRSFNFTTAFRQPFFTPLLRPFFYLYLPFIGFNPLLTTTIGIINLVWAVWSHTQHIGKLGFLGWIIVTPSAHRVHHGTNAQYIDKNYGDILIIWDIMFGTYKPEKEKVEYGLTRNIETYNPVKIIFHEWIAWIKDLKKSNSIGEIFEHTFRPPK